MHIFITKKNFPFFIIIFIISIIIIKYVYQLYKHHQTEKEFRLLLLKKPVNHLAIIMDGNRRWAKKNGFVPWVGHQKGVQPIKKTIQFCFNHNIKTLTLYAFSLENFKRPENELHYLFDILAQEIASKEMNELYEKGICVKFIGDRAQFPEQLLSIIEMVEKNTAGNANLFLNLLFCYGGHQEIFSAVRRMCIYCKNENMNTESITPELWMSMLWSHKIPPVDLLIRTAGDQRLSNFLPLQTAYTQLYFLSCYWPELDENHLIEATKFFLNSRNNQGV